MRLFIVLLLMIGFLGCNKEDETKTKLELNILDQHGNPAKDFNVNLFGNVDDFKMDKPVLQSGKTNQNGVVTFSNLHNIKYYFRATKGCENNNLGAITTVDPIVTDFTTVVTLQVQETCHFTISNNSSDNYQVYYNGVSKYVIPGHSFKTFLNGFPTGTTKVRALQLDGFILFPTDLTFTIDAECNSSEGVVIP